MCRVGRIIITGSLDRWIKTIAILVIVDSLGVLSFRSLEGGILVFISATRCGIAGRMVILLQIPPLPELETLAVGTDGCTEEAATDAGGGIEISEPVGVTGEPPSTVDFSRRIDD